MFLNCITIIWCGLNNLWIWWIIFGFILSIYVFNWSFQILVLILLHVFQFIERTFEELNFILNRYFLVLKILNQVISTTGWFRIFERYLTLWIQITIESFSLLSLFGRLHWWCGWLSLFTLCYRLNWTIFKFSKIDLINKGTLLEFDFLWTIKVITL